MGKTQPGVLGIYSHMDTLLEAIEHFKGEGKKLKVFSPCPRHEIEEALDEGVSPVRRFTLIGGLLGCITGYTFTSFTSLDWILPTSGKPIVSPVAFTVIAFELTILFGSIFTIAGIALNAGLFRKRTTIYDDRFTEDKFGIFIPCDDEQEIERLKNALTEQGAEEVKHG
jgi:molybdopterin-containing oxidoreductase family membrane subunit